MPCMNRSPKSICCLDAVGLVGFVFFFLSQMFALPLVRVSYLITYNAVLSCLFTDVRSKSKATDTFVLFQLVYHWLVVDVLLGWQTYSLHVSCFCCHSSLCCFQLQKSRASFSWSNSTFLRFGLILSVLALVWKFPASSMSGFDTDFFFSLLCVEENINRWNSVLHSLMLFHNVNC